MPGEPYRWLSAHLFEIADSSPNVHVFCAEAACVLRRAIRCDCLYWQRFVLHPDPGHIIYADASAPDDLRIPAQLMCRRAGRYAVASKRVAAILARDECAVARDDWTAQERDRDPLFVEVFRPAHIEDCLTCASSFRGCPTSILGFVRCDRSPFGPVDRAIAHQIRKHVGLIELALKPALSPPAATSSVDDLSPREGQVARLIASGLHNKEVAQLLGTSLSTVHNQTLRIYNKLGVSNRTQLASRLQSDGGGSDVSGEMSSASQ